MTTFMHMTITIFGASYIPSVRLIVWYGINYKCLILILIKTRQNTSCKSTLNSFVQAQATNITRARAALPRCSADRIVKTRKQIKLLCNLSIMSKTLIESILFIYYIYHYCTKRHPRMLYRYGNKSYLAFCRFIWHRVYTQLFYDNIRNLHSLEQLFLAYRSLVTDLVSEIWAAKYGESWKISLISWSSITL
jgi:hypothetical protein